MTRYDLLVVALPHTLVSIDARLPSQLLYEALQAGSLAEFQGYAAVRRAYTRGESRLDFALEAEGPGRSCLVEAKSVTLVRDGVGYFPDAVTTRGTRHLLELGRAALDGNRTAIVFVVQREDVSALAPHDDSDPRFGETMREVVREGVEAYAYSCRVSRSEVVLWQRVPVLLVGAHAGDAAASLGTVLGAG